MMDYPNDPTEQHGGGALFAGGSTEQKDAFLGERFGQTSMRSRAFHEAMRDAQAQIDAPAPAAIDADEERAALVALVTKCWPCATATIFRGNLYALRRGELHRPLTEGEASRIASFAEATWAERHEVAA